MNGAAPDSPAGDGESPLGGVPVSPPAAASPIDPATVLRGAWKTFSACWPACLFAYWGPVTAAWLLLNLLVLFLGSLNLAIGDPGVTPLLEFLSFVGLFLIPAWLWLGQAIALLKVARREPVVLRDLFQGGPCLLTVLLAGLVFLAIVAVPCLLIYGLSEGLLALGGDQSLVAMAGRLFDARAPEAVVAVESLLLAMAGILVSLAGLFYAAFFAVRVRLRTFPFLVLDRGEGVLDSLRTSLQLSRGRVASLFLVHLAQFTINVAGFTACCAGLLVSLPFTGLISAVTYNTLAADLPPLQIADAEDDDPD